MRDEDVGGKREEKRWKDEGKSNGHRKGRDERMRHEYDEVDVREAKVIGDRR